MTLAIRAQGRSIAGRRNDNQDTYVLAPGAAVFAVLDGMGGYAGGGQASALARDAIVEFFADVQLDPEAWPSAVDPSATLARSRVVAAIRGANDKIRAHRWGPHGSMGSTVALISVVGSRAWLAHIGDSRVYRLRGRELDQLTRDHSLYEQLLADGVELPPPEAFPYANVITRALGPDQDGRPDVTEVELRAGDRFLLCTDGLTGPLATEAIAASLAGGGPGQACDRLVAAAFEAGSTDNITAIVLDVVSGPNASQ